MISFPPTVSSANFSGRDDNMFRVSGTNEVLSAALAEHCLRRLSWKTVVIVSDLANKAYSQSVINVFAQAFAAGGGQIAQHLSFNSGAEFSLKELAAKALNRKPDGVLIVAAPMNAALLCQQLKQQDSRVALAVSGWALADEFLQNGGQAVEGAIGSTYFPPDYIDPALIAFQRSFQQRFGRKPSFPAELAYEATTVLLAGLRETPSSRQLKATLLRMQRFPGLRSELIFDRFGDVQRSFSLVTIKNGAFTSLP